MARDPDTVRGPDISFVRHERLAGVDESRFFEGAPDLAVEIRSPSSRPYQLRAKVADYLAAGGRLVWVVDPETRTVTAYRAGVLMAVYAGKVVVVSGASQGIGKALCLELAAQRPRLVLAARDTAALEAVAAECRAGGAETLVVPTDVGDEAACRALVEKAVERYGALDVLVNNAGMGMLAPSRT